MLVPTVYLQDLSFPGFLSHTDTAMLTLDLFKVYWL